MHRMFTYRTFSYLRCPQCAHVTTLPYPTTAQIVRHYQDAFRSRNYRTVRERAPIYRDAMGRLLDLLERELVARGMTFNGASLLDIGCFTGEFLEAARERGVDGYGVELQDEAVAIANERLPGRVQRADVMADALEFPRAQFHIVSLLGVVEHVTDPVKLLRRVRELLAPGGICFIQTPNAEAFFATLLRRYWPPYAPIEHIHLFSRTSLVRVLSQEGFVAITTRRHVKRLTSEYVYDMLPSFGPEFRPFLTPMYRLLPTAARQTPLPFYIGEMAVIASRG